MAINFDLNDLLAFRAVAELSNFRRAAESVNISQPAFSRRIDKLEQALGVRLLDRTTRRVNLTAVGRDFHRKVVSMLDELDGTLLSIRGMAATRLGEVTIACVPSTVYYFLPQVIQRYQERHPKIRVKVFDASANEVLAAVARGEADFGLNFMGGQEPDIEFKTLLEERFVGRLPARPSARQEALDHLERAGAVRLHLGQQVIRQSPAAGPGPGARDWPPADQPRGAACDHHARSGRGGSRGRCGAVAGHAGARITRCW